MAQEKAKMTRINITVPEDLLVQFKAYCDRQVRPVSAQIQYMMRQAVEAEQAKDDES